MTKRIYMIFFSFIYPYTIVCALALRGALAAAICLTNPSWSLTPVLHIQKTEGVGEDNLSSREQMGVGQKAGQTTFVSDWIAYIREV